MGRKQSKPCGGDGSVGRRRVRMESEGIGTRGRVTRIVVAVEVCNGGV